MPLSESAEPGEDLRTRVRLICWEELQGGCGRRWEREPTQEAHKELGVTGPITPVGGWGPSLLLGSLMGLWEATQHLLLEH